MPAGAPADRRSARSYSTQAVGCHRARHHGSEAGARSDEQEADLRRLLFRFHLLDFDNAADFDAAGRIYRKCRRAGITPRGMVDCMIASVASRHGATILARDVDMNRVAGVVGIEMDDASLTS